VGLYIGGYDYGGEDVDSSHDIPEVLIESSVRVSVVEVDDACDQQ